MQRDLYSSHTTFQAGLAFLVVSLALNVMVMAVSLWFFNISDRAYTVLSMVLEAGMAIPFLIFCASGRIQARQFFNHRHIAADLLLGILIGFAMMLVVGMVNLLVELAFSLLGMVPVGGTVESVGSSWLDFALNLTATALAAAVGEELLVRGMLFPALSRKLGMIGAILVSSAFFAMLHGSPSSLPYTFIHGVVLCVIFVITGNLWASMAYHFTVNGYAVIVTFLMDQFSGLFQQYTGQSMDQMQAMMTSTPTNLLLTILEYVPTFAGALAVAGVGLFALTRVHRREGGYTVVPVEDRTVSGWILMAMGLLICLPRFALSLTAMILGGMG